jgi:uncharacterized membrane protein YhiD involved in acid resistance
METRHETADLTDHEGIESEWRSSKITVTLHMQVKGKQPISDLVSALSSIDGVHEVGTVNEESDWD